MVHEVFAKVRRFGVAIACSCLLVSTAGAKDLVEVYEMALVSDPVLKTVRAQRNASQENVPIAKSLLLPNLSMGATVDRRYEDIDSDLVSNSQSFNEGNAAVQVTQALYDRASWYGVDQAENVSKSADENYRAAELDLMIRTANAYFDVLTAQEVVIYRKAEIAAIKRQLDQAKQRFEVGLIAITSVYEAQASYDGARADLVSAENNLDNANQALAEIVGKELKDLAQLQEELPLEPPEPQDIEYWAKLAQETNPSILSDQQAAEATKQGIEIARSGHYPILDAYGNASYYKNNSNINQRTDVAEIGVQMVLPIYSGGGVTASTRQASYDYQASLEQLDTTRRLVDTAVRDAFRAVESDILRVQALKATVKSGVSSVAATEAGYEVGTRTIIDVLNQQRALYLNKSEYAAARYNYIRSNLSLKQAAGTLSLDDIKHYNRLLVR